MLSIIVKTMKRVSSMYRKLKRYRIYLILLKSVLINIKSQLIISFDNKKYLTDPKLLNGEINF